MSDVESINFNFGSLEYLPVEELREFISIVEQSVGACEQIEVPCNHHHANVRTDKGLYARSIELKSGSLIVGKIHKYETINIISSGDVSILSQDGVTRKKAPYIFVSTPGAKRVIYAHEDSTWTCVHATGETDLEKIEDEFIAKDYSEVPNLKSDSKVLIGE